MKLRLRIKMAWRAFWFLPFEIQVKPFHKTGYCRKGVECDNHYTWRISFKNEATIYLEETVARFKVSEENAYLLCDQCAEKAIGTTEKIDNDV